MIKISVVQTAADNWHVDIDSPSTNISQNGFKNAGEAYNWLRSWVVEDKPDEVCEITIHLLSEHTETYYPSLTQEQGQWDRNVPLNFEQYKNAVTKLISNAREVFNR